MLRDYDRTSALLRSFRKCINMSISPLNFCNLRSLVLRSAMSLFEWRCDTDDGLRVLQKGARGFCGGGEGERAATGCEENPTFSAKWASRETPRPRQQKIIPTIRHKWTGHEVTRVSYSSPLIPNLYSRSLTLTSSSPPPPPSEKALP